MLRTPLFLIAYLVVFAGKLYAQTPNWIWAKGAGGVNDEMGRHIAVDGAGNVYVAGHFSSSSVLFGSNALSSAGGADAFLVKYDADGNVLWARSSGGSGGDYCYGLAIDKTGEVYITGYFNSAAMSFGSTSITNTSAGTYDIFIAKYDTLGNIMWAENVGGSASDYAFSVSTDHAGGVYISGMYSSASLSFGPSILANAGNNDVFILKFNSIGTQLWAKQIKGTGDDRSYAIAAGNGSVFISGYSSSTSVSADTLTLSNTVTKELFLAAYDTSGRILWASNTKGSGVCNNLSVTPDGKLYLVGSFFSSSITFGSAILNNSSSGYDDVFLAAYTTSGGSLWAKRAGGSDRDYGFGISADSAGMVYVSGYFHSGIINFGSASLNNTSVATHDVFVAAFDTSGNSVWAKSAGTAGDEGCFGLALSKDGSIYVSGFFSGTSVTFGSTTLTNNGSVDFYVAKLSSLIGISDWFHDKQRFILYPNPLKKGNDLRFSTNIRYDECIFTVSDLLGREFFFKNISGDSQLIEAEDVFFSPGIYVINLTINGANHTGRLLVTEQ